jgi:hypothetical protein
MDLHFALLALGGLLLVGLLTDEIGRRTHLPRVTLLIVFGALAGPDAFDLLPKGLLDWYEFFASVALTMVAFLLGGTLSRVALREHGKTILVISVSVVCVTVIVVSAGLLAIGAPVVLALLLAGIATATAPAAIRDVVRQLDAKGSFSKVLLGIVAVDDAWGLIAFSLLLVAAKAISGDGSLYILYWSPQKRFPETAACTSWATGYGNSAVRLRSVLLSVCRRLISRDGSGRASRLRPRRSVWCSFVPDWRFGLECHICLPAWWQARSWSIWRAITTGRFTRSNISSGRSWCCSSCWRARP